MNQVLPLRHVDVFALDLDRGRRRESATAAPPQERSWTTRTRPVVSRARWMSAPCGWLAVGPALRKPDLELEELAAVLVGRLAGRRRRPCPGRGPRRRGSFSGRRQGPGMPGRRGPPGRRRESGRRRSSASPHYRGRSPRPAGISGLDAARDPRTIVAIETESQSRLKRETARGISRNAAAGGVGGGARARGAGLAGDVRDERRRNVGRAPGRRAAPADTHRAPRRAVGPREAEGRRLRSPGGHHRRAPVSRDALRAVFRRAHDRGQCPALPGRPGPRDPAHLPRAARRAFCRQVHELQELPSRGRHRRRAHADLFRLQPQEPRAGSRGRPRPDAAQFADARQRPPAPLGLDVPALRRRVHDAAGPRRRDDDRPQLRLAAARGPRRHRPHRPGRARRRRQRRPRAGLRWLLPEDPRGDGPHDSARAAASGGLPHRRRVGDRRPDRRGGREPHQRLHGLADLLEQLPLRRVPREERPARGARTRASRTSTTAAACAPP